MMNLNLTKYTVSAWIVLMVTLALYSGCGNTVGNRTRVPNIVIKIPNSQPSEKYAFLVRLKNATNPSVARDIFVPTEPGGGLISSDGLVINLKADEQGIADVKAYKLLSDGTACAESSAAWTVEINEPKTYSWDIAGFEAKGGNLCPLTIDRERRYGEYIPGGKIQVALAGDSEPVIDCGTKCYYFFPQNSTLTVLAVPQENYKLADITSDVPILKKDSNAITIALNKSGNIVPNFISSSCVSGSGMVCDDPTAPIGLDLVAISGTSENDVWAVGSDKATGAGVVAYYTAGSWRRLAVPMAPAFAGVWMSGPGNAWVVGDTKLYNCKPIVGSISCTQMALSWPGGPMAAEFLIGVSGSGDKIWLLGSSGQTFYGLWPATGTSVGLVSVCSVTNALLISAIANDEVYLAGDSLATCKIGSATSPKVSPTSPYAAIYLQPGTRDLILADISGGLWKYGGSGLSAKLNNVPKGQNVKSLFRDDMGRVWLVGDSGFVQLWSNDSFSSLASPSIDARTSQDLKGVWSFRGNTWLVGQDVVRFYKG